MNYALQLLQITYLRMQRSFPIYSSATVFDGGKQSLKNVSCRLQTIISWQQKQALKK